MMMGLAIVAALAGIQTGDSDAAARELSRIERQLARTWKEGDCEAWGAFIAPEWAVIHVTGAVIRRAEALQMCEAPQVPIEEISVDELSVRSYGDAAVVTGRTTARTGGAEPRTVTLRFTDVFVRRGGRWQAVASQATRLLP